jgi:WD40 repeat protein
MTDSTLVRTIAGLTGTCFAISPDGSKLVSGTTDWKVNIWNFDTGEQTRVLSGHTYSVYSVAWDPASQYVVSASGDGSARVWGPFF